MVSWLTNTNPSLKRVSDNMCMAVIQCPLQHLRGHMAIDGIFIYTFQYDAHPILTMFLPASFYCFDNNEMDMDDSLLNTSTHDFTSTICISSCGWLSSDIEPRLQMFDFNAEDAEGTLLLPFRRLTSCSSARKNTSSAGRLMRHVEYLNMGSHRVF